MTRIRIGSVPYLNAKPLVAWFEAGGARDEADLSYAVPSVLARMLRDGRLDVAMVSTFELVRAPGLFVVPDVSIAADGPVKSVRLFSRVVPSRIASVALDTSSLTSVNLTRVLLAERYRVAPRYTDMPPDLETMLTACDAGVLIGDLKLFSSPARYILDLGDEWKGLTGRPFVYAAWLARNEEAADRATPLLAEARRWGEARLEDLSVEWSGRMDLPLDRVRDYFLNVMRYDLDAAKRDALLEYQARCVRHGLASQCYPIRFAGEANARP